jgi:SAM-dependent methyltransferase
MNKLHAGCGEHYVEGWINLDIRDDIPTDVKTLHPFSYPFQDDYLDAIYIAHVIEHLEPFDVLLLLEELKRISKPGAPVLITGPDIKRLLVRWMEEPRDPIDEMYPLLILEGGEDVWPDLPNRNRDHHRWNTHAERVHEMALSIFPEAEIIQPYTGAFPPQGPEEWFDPVNQMTWPTQNHSYWDFGIMCYA